MGCNSSKQSGQVVEHVSAQTTPAGNLLDDQQPSIKPALGMPKAAEKYLLDVKLKVEAPLDAGFRPLVLGKRKYIEAASRCNDKISWALLREGGCARYELPVFPSDHDDVDASIYLAGVLIQEMLWQRSAYELQLAGPEKICLALKADFSLGGRYDFEVKSMPRVCGTTDKPFKVEIKADASALEPSKDTPVECGTEANGCRLAFDLGKSDIKTVAVKDGKVEYSKETEWDVTNSDPDYHYKAIRDALLVAKQHLDRVDAVGGSATGTISLDNGATWCDIFPNVPAELYQEKVVDIFRRLAKDIAGEAPLKVINDGEVTALAAVQRINSLRKEKSVDSGSVGNVMGISMGSSEGAGYANAQGNLTGWINELCYVKLDMNPEAPLDPWSCAHRGLSHMYLGQRGATKLAGKAGLQVPPNQVYPHDDMCQIKHDIHADCLKNIQKAMQSADLDQKAAAEKIYRTVGVYLGYALAQYREFYKIDHLMILGRVSKGEGGDMMLQTAREVLEKEFDGEGHIEFYTADDEFKAVGQCIAAAALPIVDLKVPDVEPSSDSLEKAVPAVVIVEGEEASPKSSMKCCSA